MKMIDAVSAILICDNEVFVIRRQPHLRAFPGYLAFPGGKIDEEDACLRLDFPLANPHPDAHITALARELDEELSFDLGAAFEAGEVKELTLFGTAVTPAFEKIRFNAHYYKVVLRSKPAFRFDFNEIAEGGWHRPDWLSAQYHEGKALMVVPMRNSLIRLAEDITSEHADCFNLVTPEGHLPCVELIDGLRTIPVPSNTLPPAHTTNCLLLGDAGARQVLVDPSPKSETVYGQLLETLVERRVDAVLITHHHPDHHERAPRLARALGVPVLLSRRTYEYLVRGRAADYLGELGLEFIAEGQAVTRWKNSEVRAYELPGHDDGMLGLAPDTLDWFFVADLAQTGGSIVLPDEGGDLRLYCESLQRVIDLDPSVVLPSHGIPSGGSGLLRHTLQHRIDRENQIRPLYEADASVEEILHAVYPVLEPRLENLAVQTIHQHIRKLEAETR